MSAPLLSVTFVSICDETQSPSTCGTFRSVSRFGTESQQTIFALVWAGWADAAALKIMQAHALGASLASTRFTNIQASDLKRAFSTAQAVYDAQPAGSQPPLTSSPLLREQNFGIAEGQAWAMQDTPGLSREEHYAKGVYPVLLDRDDRFPDGESLNDLRARAEQAVRELILPHAWATARAGERGIHIAIVSHGLCISELVPALLRLDAGVGLNGHVDKRYNGLRNTAWTRVVIDLKAAREAEPLEFPDSNPPPLTVRVSDFNRQEHLTGVVRQKGGIGSSAHDPKQKDIRAFFGGGTAPAKAEALDRAESNVEDQAVLRQDE